MYTLFKRAFKYILTGISILCLIFFIQPSYGSYHQTKGLDYELILIHSQFKITSLMNAALQNDIKAVSVFLASGAEPNEKNFAGCTALHFAARKGDAKIVGLLVDNGAHLDVKDNDGWTPLMRANLAGNGESVKVLVEAGANIWHLNKWEESALVHSAMSNCLACAKILIDNTKLTNDKDIPLFKKQLNEAQNIINKKYNKNFQAILKQFEVSLNNRESSRRDIKIKTLPKPQIKSKEIMEVPEISEVSEVPEIDLNESEQEKKKPKKAAFFKNLFRRKEKKVESETILIKPKKEKIESENALIESREEELIKKTVIKKPETIIVPAAKEKEIEVIKEIDLNERQDRRSDRQDGINYKHNRGQREIIPNEKPIIVETNSYKIKEVNLNSLSRPSSVKNTTSHNNQINSRHRNIIPREKIEFREN
jgi:hypothetical protein